MATQVCRLAALAALAASPAAAWIALSPVDATGKVTAFQLADTGARGADIITFPVNAGEVVLPNAFACGRCFCLVLATNPPARSSTLYNFSFCAWVPTPTLESMVHLPGIAYNIHSFEGEGDGGDGITLLTDHTKRPATYSVARVAGNQVEPLVDISKFVDAFGGNIFPGGTAWCASTQTLWVAIQTQNPAHDTLITVDLGKRAVVGNLSIVKPALTAHFADCGSNAVGGFTQVGAAAPGGQATVQVGMLTKAGAFNVLDQIKLPAGSSLHLTGIADFLHDPRWNPSEYGALLYSGAPGGETLPGAIFTSKGKMGSATLSPLNVQAASISVEY